MEKLKNNWFIFFSGIWLIFLGLFGFPSSVQKTLTIITGIIIAFVSFRREINSIVNEKIS